MEKIKYGIIGAGTMAREHILNLSLIDEAEVVALSDPHEESLKQCQELLKSDAVCFKNHQDLIKENLVDVYIISSPNFTHIQILKDVKICYKLGTPPPPIIFFLKLQCSL